MLLKHTHHAYSMVSSISRKPYHKKPQSLISANQAQQGFTLVELVVVVVILSVFAGMMSLSVGSSESRKNRAFYEHLIDSLQYVRLLSAERMQPMGLSLQTNKQGQLTPVIVALSDPYVAYQQAANAQGNRQGGDAYAKNAMELSAMSINKDSEQPTPTWQIDNSVTLPEPPDTITIDVNALDSGQTMGGSQRPLQPWFVGQQIPQVIWFGTGQATPVTIEIKNKSGLVGEVITILPNGSVKVGQSS